MLIRDFALDPWTGDVYFVGENQDNQTSDLGTIAVIRSNGQVMKIYDHANQIYDVTLDPYNR